MTTESIKQSSNSRVLAEAGKKPSNIMRMATALALPVAIIAASAALVFNLDTLLK
jgi:hypothetical protein